MHARQIITALATLDPDDEDQWTEDGAPRLDVLNDLLPAVTRQQIVKAAPLFSQKNPVLPDLDKELAEAEEASASASELKAKAKEAEKRAAAAAHKVQGHDALLRDRHTLTRQNQAWIKSQNEESLKRHQRQQEIDRQLNIAGGTGNVGLHPVERNEAARVRNKRRQPAVIQTQKKA